nr:MAG TPA: hypothetical protein [Caudoviricetes sp.]
MYNKDYLKTKLKAYSVLKDSDLMGMVSILEKSLKERFKEDSIYTIPPYMEGSLQDIVAKNTTMTMGIQEAVETKYNIEKMCDDYEEYYNKLLNIIKSANDRHEKIIDEIKEERKPRTFSKVSRIISRVTQSGVLEYPTYPAHHNWEWFDDITEEINEILNDKTLSEYEFDVEFISTDTMSIAEENKFKVMTVMYFKLTEYIPDEE